MAQNFDDGDWLFNFVVENGNDVKGLVDLGLTKVPERYIQPPQERIDKQTARMHAQPPIDLSKLDGPEHEQVVEEIARAAEILGFFQVVNHGVPFELLESLKEAAHSFFDQSPEKKAVYRQGVSPSPLVKYATSFVPDKEKALEWRDYVNIQYTPDSEHWPNQFKEVVLEYLKTSNHMVKKLFEVLVEKLGVTLDDSKIDALVGFNKNVNINYYPACPNPDLTVGAGRHSGIGTLTTLLQDGIGGLYMKVEEDIEDVAKTGEWIEIPPIPGALVINIGDALQILSNGRYKSAEHRVRTSTQSRVSIPIFSAPKLTEKVGPLPELVERDHGTHSRYREFVFQDYLNNFFSISLRGRRSLLILLFLISCL